jgi:quinol monooxygenase YgiN
MIIIAGTIDFDTAHQRDQAVASGLALQQATRDEERGCLAYCFAADPCVAARVQVHEVWEDESSLAAHFEHPNYLQMRELLMRGGVVATDVKKYRCDLSEPVYDRTMTPRADFFTA